MGLLVVEEEREEVVVQTMRILFFEASMVILLVVVFGCCCLAFASVGMKLRGVGFYRARLINSKWLNHPEELRLGDE